LTISAAASARVWCVCGRPIQNPEHQGPGSTTQMPKHSSGGGVSGSRSEPQKIFWPQRGPEKVGRTGMQASRVRPGSRCAAARPAARPHHAETLGAPFQPAGHCMDQPGHASLHRLHLGAVGVQAQPEVMKHELPPGCAPGGRLLGSCWNGCCRPWRGFRANTATP
jgi:hypothetical protein